jgi:SH3 domain-containing YSC84-like protein 1
MQRLSMLVLFLAIALMSAPCQEQKNQQDQNQQAQKSQQAQNQQDQDYEVPPDPAVVKEKQVERLEDSREVLKDLLYGRLNVPKSLVEKAKCIVVIPGVKKFAFVVGMGYGKGTMTCRTGQNFDREWSAPAMFMLAGGNVGLQAGVQSTDLVLLLMNERGVNSLLQNKVKLGGDVTVAAGPLGRSFQASTDLSMAAEILSYSRAHGIFAGAAVDGSTLRPDVDGNAVLYGDKVTVKEIVRSGNVPIPQDAKPMIQILEQASAVASAAEVPKQPKK